MNTVTQKKDTASCTAANSTNCVAPTNRDVKPKYAVTETESAFEVSVEVPGAKRESVEIGFDGGVLDITASRTDSIPESWRPLGSVVSRPNYRLKFSVADSIDAGKISASVENGILKLNLPLKEAVKPRSISVN